VSSPARFAYTVLFLLAVSSFVVIYFLLRMKKEKAVKKQAKVQLQLKKKEEKIEKKEKKERDKIIKKGVFEQDRIVYQPLTDDQQASWLKAPTASLSWANFKALHRHLPERFWMNDVSLIFDTKKDGISYTTFYSRAKEQCPTLLIVRDMNGHVFGSYCSSDWKAPLKKDAVEIVGSGENFLFTFYPSFRVFHADHSENEMFQVCESNHISFGAPHPGLWIAADFASGRSEKSETYNNECLTTKDCFEIASVELWRLNLL